MRDIVMNAFTSGAVTWGNLLIGSAMKGVVLLSVAGLITLLLRRAPAATRHYVWTVAISALVLLPLAGFVAPRWNVTFLTATIAPSLIPPSVTEPSSVEIGKRPDANVVPAPSVATPNAPPSEVPLASPRQEITPSSDRAATLGAETSKASIGASVATSALPLDWWMILSAIWIIGAMLLMTRLLVGQWGTARLARRSAIVEDVEWIALVNRLSRQLGIARPVTLLRSNGSGIPMTWGVFYPVILLPQDADSWTPERRVAVLLHELAHIHRFDALTQTVAQLAGAMFWVNPLVWIAARQMRTERERACDDFVIAFGMRPSAYASDLLEIVRTMGSEPGMAYAALAMARRSEFEGRLLAILDPKARRKGMGRAGKLITATAAVALVFPLAAMTPAVRVVEAKPQSESEAAAVARSRGVMALQQGAARDDSSERNRDKAATDAGTPNRDSMTIVRPEQVTSPVSSLKENLVAQPEEAEVSTPVASAPVAAAARPRDDKQTLILVVRAAARMTSDYEKAALLVEVVEKFVADDSLRLAFLATAATLTGDYERARVLSALLAKDPLSDVSRVAFVKTAAGLSSDYTRRTVLTKFVAKHELTNGAVRQAFFAAVGKMSAGYDQQQLLVALLKRVPRLSRDEALGVLTAAKGMSSSSSKSAVLIAVAEKIGLADEVVRKAYIDVAGTLSSDAEYRRAMSAAIKAPTPQ